MSSCGCTNGSVGRHLRGDDDPHGAADEPRGDVRAVERQRADDAQRLGLETSTSVSTDCDGAYGIIRAAIAGSGSAQ